MSSSPGTAVVLFTRDLRVRDNPTLHAAVGSAERVVPLFVLDDAILRSAYPCPNRATFLAEALADLDASLRDRGAGLVVRRGDLAEEVAGVAEAVGAGTVHVSGDVSGFAQRRAERLRDRLAEDGRELEVHDETLWVVPPGRLAAQGKDHMAVFSPYFRRWEQQDRRDPLPAPRALKLPRIPRGALPKPADISDGTPSPDLLPGGETAARKRMQSWLRSDAAGEYGGDGHDDLGTDGTSRLSSYLHFGCLSPLELATRAQDVSPEFVRQICWRDFHGQVLGARPDATRTDYRTRGDRWSHDQDLFDAWCEGRTGYPVVDAGMRQLLQEGWMHNRARLIVGHFLTKTLYVDWRLGAQHFIDLLVDGDTANNTMNWQWVAGTGTDSRFNRTYNITDQGKRHDPHGSYVRRYVPELAGIESGAVHEPWKLKDDERAKLDYPEPIVDNREGNARFLAARGK